MDFFVRHSIVERLQNNKATMRTGVCVILLWNVIVVSKKNAKGLFKKEYAQLVRGAGSLNNDGFGNNDQVEHIADFSTGSLIAFLSEFANNLKITILLTF